jgi:nucleoside 2-deoxyribosyltransferase|tara:strand:- start:14 stop:493 length:480 start_codon:yes stop_codon:yes gene_type:complete
MGNLQHSVYIAGPFFNPKQLKLIQTIEETLHHLSIPYFSPRSFGALGEMGTEERKAAIKSVYAENVAQIAENKVMLAVIDDNDVGTIWEMGYASKLNRMYSERKLITMSDQGYGMNIMLRECVDAHLHGFENFNECLMSATRLKDFDGDKFMADRGEAW